MEPIQGSLRVIRISPDTASEPWKYRVGFAPYATSERPPIRDIVGDDQLERILRLAVRLSEDAIRESVHRARQGYVVIDNVPLTEELNEVLR